MIVRPSVRGPRLHLRVARPDDAPYLHALRTDPALARHLSPTEGGVGAQAAWLRAYVERERRGEEAYYVVEHDARPIGCVRLTELDRDRFTWGSWILDPAAKPPRAALETALLVYRLGFGVARKREAVFDVRRANAPVLAFHDRFGAQRTAENGLNVYYRLCSIAWRERASAHWDAVERVAAAATPEPAL